MSGKSVSKANQKITNFLGGSGTRPKGNGTRTKKKGSHRNMAPNAGVKHYRPSKKDLARVKRLILLGENAAGIADFLGISPQQLQLHYGPELKCYRKERLAQVADKTVSSAVRGYFPAAQFVLKTQAGWKENTPGSDPNNPLCVKHIVGVGDDAV